MNLNPPQPSPDPASLPSPSARRGKIARLPSPIRDQLNLRLDNNQPASDILRWLNALPETRQLLADSFDNVPISEQNLSQWRLGGFREWRLRHDFLDDAARLAETASTLQNQSDPSQLADNLALVLAARYAAILNNWDGEITPEFEASLAVLRRLTQDVVQLQKALHRADDHQVRRQENRDQRLQKAKDDALTRLGAVSSEATLAPFVGRDRARRTTLIHCAKTPADIERILAAPSLLKPNQTSPQPPTPTRPSPSALAP